MFLEPQMTDLPPEEQAKKAIRHVLTQIRDHPQIGYHMGWGTQSHSLLCEAAATLFGGTDMKEVARNFAPQNPSKD